jgi:hypothetical protein
VKLPPDYTSLLTRAKKRVEQDEVKDATEQRRIKRPLDKVELKHRLGHFLDEHTEEEILASGIDETLKPWLVELRPAYEAHKAERKERRRASDEAADKAPTPTSALPKPKPGNTPPTKPKPEPLCPRQYLCRVPGGGSQILSEEEREQLKFGSFGFLRPLQYED